MKIKLILSTIALFAVLSVTACHQSPVSDGDMVSQSFDPDYVAPKPMHPANTGTTIYIDAAHNNFHTFDGRFSPFSDLVKNDGFNVAAFKDQFTAESLADVKILVISNPVNAVNHPEVNWVSPILSAFTNDEVDALVEWVENGGSLLLIADHYPFPGAVNKLASRFGFQVDNGYNFDPEYYAELEAQFFQLPIIIDVMAGNADPSDNAVLEDIMMQAGDLFVQLGAEVNTLSYWNSAFPLDESVSQSGDGNFIYHELMANGASSSPDDSTPYVVTFTGHSFDWIPTEGVELEPLFVMGKGTYTVLTEAQDAYFGPDSNTSNTNTLVSLLSTGKVPEFVVPVVDSKEKLQAAIAKVGQGKVAFFGEAGMFTAQIAADGVTKMGLNNSNAEHNWKFVLNLMRYLDRFDPATASESHVENPELTSMIFQSFDLKPFNLPTNS